MSKTKHFHKYLTLKHGIVLTLLRLVKLCVQCSNLYFPDSKYHFISYVGKMLNYHNNVQFTLILQKCDLSFWIILSTLKINTNCNRLLFLSYSNELHALGGYELAKSLHKDTVRITAMPKSSHSIHSMFMNHKAQCEVTGQARDWRTESMLKNKKGFGMAGLE